MDFRKKQNSGFGGQEDDFGLFEEVERERNGIHSSYAEDDFGRPGTTDDFDEGTRSNQNGRGLYMGIVRGYSRDEVGRSFIEKYVSTLFHGVPLPSGRTVHSFQLFDEESLRRSGCANLYSTEVKYYGDIDEGQFLNGENVSVWGTKNSRGILYAKKIRKNGSGVYVRPRGSISAALVRTLTLLGILGVLMFTQGAAGVLSAGANAVSGFSAESIARYLLLIIPILLLIFGMKISQITGIPYKYLAVTSIVILALLIPDFGVLVLTVVAIIYLFKKLLKP